MTTREYIVRKKRILVSGAVAAAATLALAGCGGGGGGGEGGGDASTLTILDYYDNEPDSTLVQEALDALVLRTDLAPH